MTPRDRKLIRLAFHARDPDLRRRAVGHLRSAREKLPRQPWSVMQEAREEGLIAGEDEDDLELEAVTLFDSPEEVVEEVLKTAAYAKEFLQGADGTKTEKKSKKTSLNSEDRALIKMARATGCPELRRRLVRLVIPSDG